MRWSNVGAGCDCMFFGAALRRSGRGGLCRTRGSLTPEQKPAHDRAVLERLCVPLYGYYDRVAGRDRAPNDSAFRVYPFFRRRSRRPTAATNPVESSTTEVGSGTGLGLPTVVRKPRISPVGNASV
jgi:hypothetical protein